MKAGNQISETEFGRELASSENYIGEQSAVECPNCGHETAMLGAEEIPHCVLPITLPLNRCFTCGFTYTDYHAEDMEAAYLGDENSVAKAKECE